MAGVIRSRIRRRPRNLSSTEHCSQSMNESPKPAPATWEGTPAMSTDSLASFGCNRVTALGARLGSSLHVKGEISGNEDLLIDGSVEGLITSSTSGNSLSAPAPK